MMRDWIISGQGRVLGWLARPQGAAKLWLSRTSIAAAWLGLTLAVISPPQGFGVDICWFHSNTGLPCPGCGMTRSMSCGLRGLFAESWKYHPLGLPVLALFLMTAAYSLMPARVRSGVREFIETRGAGFKAVYLAFVVMFLGFGLLRAVWEAPGIIRGY